MPSLLDHETGFKVSLKNILFATDFSKQSASALAYARPIARRYGSKLYAVHVSSEPAGLPNSAREGLQAMGVQRQAESHDVLSNLGARLGDIPHEILTRKGEVWAELSKIMDERNIDLILAGTHGRTGVGKVLMGSVAEKIFRRAACPVLTVGPAVSGEPDSIVDLHEILFATDFSAESLAALRYAISLAKENHARLYLLHVAEDRTSAEDEDALKDRLRALVPEESQLACRPKALIEYGAPAERILSVAEEMGMDLIVLGVKRTPLYFEVSRHLPLATAYKVVSQAICPVLTVRG